MLIGKPEARKYNRLLANFKVRLERGNTAGSP